MAAAERLFCHFGYAKTTVADIARAATRLGPLVTIAHIDGAIHDVFLSAPEPRDAAYGVLRRWLVSGALG